MHIAKAAVGLNGRKRNNKFNELADEICVSKKSVERRMAT